MKSERLSLCLFAHSSQLGGAERCLIDLIELLLARNIRCGVVMPGEGPLTVICRDLKVPVKTYSFMSWWCKPNNDPETIFGDILHTLESDFEEIVKFVQEFSPDAVYTQTIVSPLGAIVAEFLRLPHFLGIREHADFYFAFDFQKSIEAFYHTSQFLFCVSESVGKTVLGKFYSSDNVKVNYAKVNIPVSYAQSKFKGFSQPVRIGIFGSVSDNKNQADIIKAVFILLQYGYKVELLIVGLWEGEYYNYLNDLITTTPYKENIVFTGYSETPIELMKSMNIVVSCTKSEGFGRSLVESILLKIPIVYANSSGPKEIYVHGKHGLAYELCNAQDLADKIADTIENIEHTQQRVEKAFEYVSNKFTQERYCQPIIEALKSVKQSPLLRDENYITQLIFSVIPIQDIRKKQKKYFNFLANKNTKIVFFGASGLFEKATQALSKYNIFPDYVCDNDPQKQNQTINRYKIYLPDELLRDDRFFIVIITSSFITEIKEQVLKYPNIIFVDHYKVILNALDSFNHQGEYLFSQLNKSEEADI